MPDEDKGVDGEETRDPAEAPAESESPADEGAEEKKEKQPDDEPRVPYDRFNEVNTEKHALEVKLAEANARLDELSKVSDRRELTSEEKQEQQAQEWVQKRIDAALEKHLGPLQQKIQSDEKIQAEEKIIEQRINLIRTADKTVDDTVEMKIYDLIEKYHISNGTDAHGQPIYAIDVAYQLWKQLEGDKQAATVAGAKGGAGPQQPHAGRTGADGTTPIDVSGKSFYELAADAKREAGLK